VLNIENQVAIRCLDKANGTLPLVLDNVGTGANVPNNTRNNSTIMNDSVSRTSSEAPMQQRRAEQEQQERAELVEAEVERQLGRIVGQFAANGVRLPLRKVR
jgi:hypothetical protein